MKSDYDITIIGGGIVGLACALALAKKGFNLALVEAGKGHAKLLSKDAPFDAKIVAITRKSELFFRDLGVWEGILNLRSCAYQQMLVWDASADGQILFTASEFFEPNLGYMIEQSVILGTLWQALLQLDNVSIFTHSQLQKLEHQQQRHLAILSNGQALSAKLIIAADGAASQARQLAQITSQGWDYQQKAVVAIVKGDLPHRLTAFQRFAADGSLALLPLADPFQCAVVWATAPSNAENLIHMTKAAFEKNLTQECDAVMDQMTLMGDRFLFPLHTHHAKNYVQERLALVGDAAHTLHPLAGQGVNLGLLDVQALAAVLIHSRQKGRDYGILSVLKRYERQRKFHNQSMILAMEAFKRGFTSQNALIQYLRNQGLSWVDRQHKLKQFLAQVALGTWSGAFW